MNDAYHSSVFDRGKADGSQEDSTIPPMGLGALSPLGQVAMDLAKRGFAVFPCKPRGKEPLTKHGYKDAARDEAQIRQWWTKWPDANIGLATGRENGIAVIDVDGPEGDKRLALLEEKFGGLPATSESSSGNGRHLWYALPDGCGPVPSSTGKGLDIRGDGGYVIAPRSVHPNGKTYEWDERSPEHLAEAPQWLLEAARDWRRFLAALDGPTTAGGRGTAQRGPSRASPGARERRSRRFGSSLSGRSWAGARALVRDRGGAASIGAHKNPRRKPRHLVEGRLRPA